MHNLEQFTDRPGAVSFYVSLFVFLHAVRFVGLRRVFCDALDADKSDIASIGLLNGKAQAIVGEDLVFMGGVEL